MSQELMPCPFCGRVPTMDSFEFGGAPFHEVRCCMVKTGHKWPATEAAKAWNTRPTAQAVAGDDARRPSDAAIAIAFRQICAADLQWSGKRHRELQKVYDLAVKHDAALQAALEGR